MDKYYRLSNSHWNFYIILYTKYKNRYLCKMCVCVYYLEQPLEKLCEEIHSKIALINKNKILKLFKKSTGKQE